jgi:type II secretory pathway component GspD/PulD (secretin)
VPLVRVFRLANADPTQLAEVLLELFRSGAGRADGAVDLRTGSIVVGGDSEQLDAAAQVVAELDRAPEGAVETHVIPMAGSAESLAVTL